MRYWTTFLFICCCFIVNPLLATNFASGNEAYERADYTKAVELYEAALAEGQQNFGLYFNLGLSYYQLKQFGPASYYLEKARQIKPNHRAAFDNLQLIEQSLPKPIKYIPDVGVKRAWNWLMGSLNANMWALVCLLMVALGVAGLSAWKFAPKRNQRAKAFVLGIVMLALSFFPLGLSLQRKALINNSKMAVVYDTPVTLRSAADLNSAVIQELSPGTRLQLSDKIGNFYKVKLSDQRVGWLPENTFKQL